MAAGRRILADLHPVAIRLVEDHPGHPYVAEAIDPALSGAEMGHGVYQCFSIALARSAEADVRLTTDRDVEVRCAAEPVEYENPVPEAVLAEFHGAG